jgi:hypothetical protein
MGRPVGHRRAATTVAKTNDALTSPKGATAALAKAIGLPKAILATNANRAAIMGAKAAMAVKVVGTDSPKTFRTTLLTRKIPSSTPTSLP